MNSDCPPHYIPDLLWLGGIAHTAPNCDRTGNVPTTRTGDNTNAENNRSFDMMLLKCNLLFLLARRQQQQYREVLSLRCSYHPLLKRMKRPLSSVAAAAMSSVQAAADNEDCADDILWRVTQELTPQLMSSSTSTILSDANKLLATFLVSRGQEALTVNELCTSADDDNVALLTCRARACAKEFQTVATATAKKSTRMNLENAAKQLTTSPAPVSILSLSLVLASLSVAVPSVQQQEEQQLDEVPASGARRAAASAIFAVASKQRWNTVATKEDSAIAATVVHSLLQRIMSCNNDEDDTRGVVAASWFDLHVIATLAKSFGVCAVDNEPLSRLTGAVITRLLYLDKGKNDNDDDDDDNASLNSDTKERETEKTLVTGALALAAQIAPWNHLAVPALIREAIPFDLWHGAERICESMINWQQHQKDSAAQEAALCKTKQVALTVIDLAMECKRYRNADNFATHFFNFGGDSRYLHARYYHACDTIAKLVRKKALPVIERQVERVDAAIAKVNAVGAEESTEIRMFALTQLCEVGEVEAAKRLADIWNMEHGFDEEALAAAVRARKEKYLQWEDVLPGCCIPELISTADQLIRGFQQLIGSSDMMGVFGFDAEWGEDSKGVALLQIATRKDVILIDIPALSTRKEGADALRKTVGELFACRSACIVGFACRQDMARLRATPCANEEHWLGKTESVIDVQPIVGRREPSLRGLGLSRASEVFLGKPLDKAEQCSYWTARPLTKEQRVYAALDAWACAAIYEKVIPSRVKEGLSI